jgi:glycosyltransferase involved in cell wall biosynthesis
MLDQPRAFGRFALSALQYVTGKEYDLVYATSSRLMTAALGALIAKRTGAPLYLDIRDIFVDTLTQVLPGKAAITLKPFFSILERWTIGRAKRVNLVSMGFEPYFRNRYPRQSFAFFTNGVDDEFIPSSSRSETAQAETNGRLRIVYAGNMGEGQGLHTIVPAIAKRLGDRAEFRLIGDGGRRLHLERALARAGVKHVQVLPPVSRTSLISEYLAADVLFLHLNDYEAFKKVLPSKIFEYAASGKPIWAGVSGYAADFLRTEVTNAQIFPPCDVEQALRVFDQLEFRDEGRAEFVSKFSRKTIMRAMAADILDHASPRR